MRPGFFYGMHFMFPQMYDLYGSVRHPNMEAEPGIEKF